MYNFLIINKVEVWGFVAESQTLLRFDFKYSPVIFSIILRIDLFDNALTFQR